MIVEEISLNSSPSLNMKASMFPTLDVMQNPLPRHWAMSSREAG